MNRLNPEVFLEWASLLKLCRDRAARNHFNYLFRTFEADPRRYPNFYAYNVSNSWYEYLDGRVRQYEPRHRR